ncbi:MAG: DNA mismatch repair protein MutS [Kofleriaceae bacterium]|nr:DNA mismatch repair protein MutS [Kofleriaceae bacterium]
MARSPSETPLMRQYLDVKDRYPDAIVLFRLGDFYEMFFEDAVVASRALDLTLTSRDKGKEDAVPMCGVPHHAARGYIAKLTELGHKVVMCEQTEDPKLAKGLVKREVVRVVTPGIVLDDEVLEPKRPRYVAALVPHKSPEGALCGLAYLDATTGELSATTLPSTGVIDELVRVAPREVIVAPELLGDSARAQQLSTLRARYKVPWNAAPIPDEAAARKELGSIVIVDERGAGGPPATKGKSNARTAPSPALADAESENIQRELSIRAAAAVVAYARATQPTGALPIGRLQLYRPGDSVVLDEAAIANLELVETLIGRHKQGSLLDVIDVTATAPGGRLLRRWLLYPLIDVAQIRRRQDAVAWLVERPTLCETIRRALSRIADLERLAGKCTLGVATPRDLGRLRDALGQLPELIALVASGKDALAPLPELLDLAACADEALPALNQRLARALVDEPPPMLKDGGVIRTGYDREVDECRQLADGGKDQILAIEEREQKGSGIANLKVRYNRVFGYYIEITKTHLAKVPSHYIRKQTVATGERYVTPELAELEKKVLTAEERLAIREAELFRAEVAAVTAVAREVAAAGAALAVLDVCSSLADVAARRGYCRPTVDDELVLEISDGRHPVIEAMLAPGTFVPNDCRLDPNAEQLVLITGPNMAGKSTYMRQVAQIALLAQIGSFVPAKAATIGICDRVFTRVGAADNLSRGDSTFMVEMRETASILAKATRRSLVILDEVGRGTSTFDGVSIAWAVSEHLHDVIGARTLFATHYHELVGLAEGRPRVRNVSVAVREHKGEIVFLRRVVPGGANKSYGVDVARLAGLPGSVITRARQIMGQLEGGALGGATPQLSLSIFAPHPTAAAPSPALAKLASIDIDNTTPRQALELLAQLKSLA